MKCTEHPELDAVGVCEKCGKSLCINCKQKLHNKTFCQTCNQEILTQEAEVAFTLANIKKRGSTGNNSPRVEEHNKASKRYIAAAALACVSLVCGIFGLIRLFHEGQYVPWGMFLSILAIALGSISRRLFRRTSPFRIIALVGMTVGFVPILLGCAALVAAV